MHDLNTSVGAFVKGDEFWDYYTIRTPTVKTDSFIGDHTRAGHRWMYDVTAEIVASEFDIMRAVAICFVYFTREIKIPVGYDYEALNPILFVELADDKRVVLGACDVEFAQEKPVLTWAWIHPQFRGMGMMTDALRFLDRKYGSFNVQFPISHGMRAALLKVGHPQAEKPN